MAAISAVAVLNNSCTDDVVTTGDDVHLNALAQSKINPVADAKSAKHADPREHPDWQKTLEAVNALSPKKGPIQNVLPDLTDAADEHGLKKDSTGKIAVTDRRTWIQERTLANSNKDPEEDEISQKDFYRHAVLRAWGQGVDINRDPKLKLLAIKAGMDLESLSQKDVTNRNITSKRKDKDLPVPGGVGYGVYYNSNSLLWSNETLLFQRMIVPRTPGGDVASTLYNTATNRSNLGVEALISYNAQSDARFRVFDWARPSADRWQVNLTYSDLSDYLGNAESDDGVWRQELLLFNHTYKTSTNNWVNAVLLQNRVTDHLDVIYMYSYTTSVETDNTYQPGEHYGSWGPIFETFQDHDGSNKPIGSHNFYLRQDGGYNSFTTTNTYVRIDDADLDPPIFLTPNTGWAVGSTSGETSTTMVEAEDMSHYIGYASGLGWRADTSNGSGWLAWGSSDRFGSAASGNRYVLQMDAMVSSTTGSTNLLYFGLFDATAWEYVDHEVISPGDFHAANNYQSFRMEVTLDSNRILFPLVYYYSSGGVSATVDKFSLALN